MVINRDCEKRIKFSLYPHYSRKSFGEGGGNLLDIYAQWVGMTPNRALLAQGSKQFPSWCWSNCPIKPIFS